MLHKGSCITKDVSYLKEKNADDLKVTIIRISRASNDCKKKHLNEFQTKKTKEVRALCLTYESVVAEARASQTEVYHVVCQV